MKKHLIAAAVAGVLAAPAMAQVTVYGIIETGIANTDNGGSAEDTTKFADSVVNSSRLGFKGEEDLGGGMKAFFRLESSLNASVGTIGKGTEIDLTKSSLSLSEDYGIKGQNNFFDRGAEVGISGGFGSIKIGKFDITNAEGVDNLSRIGNVGLFDGIDIGSDVNNAIQYKTPSFGGVQVEIGHALEDGNVGVNLAGDDQVLVSGFKRDLTSVYVGGKMGIASFGIGYTEQDTKTVTLAGATSNTEDKATTAGVLADLGVASVSLAYGKRESTGKGDVTHTILTAVAPLGSGLNVHGMYGMRDQKKTATAAKSEYDRYAVALSKDFSKRTTGYVAYSSKDVDGTNSGDQDLFYVGVKHSF